MRYSHSGYNALVEVKQSEENLKTQFLHDKRVKTLQELFQVLENGNIPDLENFLESPRSVYLPNKY